MTTTRRARYFPPRPTDRPGSLIDHCTHAAKHRHGTAVGYTVCKCREVECREAASRDRVANRAEKAADYVPAREKTPLGQLQPKKSHPTTKIPGEDTQGTWLSTRPNIAPEVARAAAWTVLCHANNDADAAYLIDALGIRELALTTRLANRSTTP